MQAIAWANKSTDSSYPDTCLQWAGFLAKLAIHYDRVSDGNADVGIMNRVSCSKICCAWGLMLHGVGGGGEVACTAVERNTIQGCIPVGGTSWFDPCQVNPARPGGWAWPTQAVDHTRDTPEACEDVQ